MQLLRIKQICGRMGLSRSTVYELMDRGELPRVVRVTSRSVCLPEHEIEAVLAARLAGRSSEEIRALVGRLESARTSCPEVRS